MKLPRFIPGSPPAEQSYLIQIYYTTALFLLTPTTPETTTVACRLQKYLYDTIIVQEVKTLHPTAKI